MVWLLSQRRPIDCLLGIRIEQDKIRVGTDNDDSFSQVWSDHFRHVRRRQTNEFSQRETADHGLLRVKDRVSRLY